ncbi:hypothetical protein AVEN_260490-1 [Araneus ventricosus]|uniref:DDE Tnp4 domain-containing protein n=1 Tax=Araneus ventricosus TaxID=182803 RepID=A0A4Y2HP73_ARAVE|nr:hypothetical protein AVEN_260490-1 [Araneus ventricosus]
MLAQYMALHFYRRTRLKHLEYFEISEQFARDIAEVYPSYGVEGLKLIEVDEPTVESKEIGHLIKREQRLMVSKKSEVKRETQSSLAYQFRIAQNTTSDVGTNGRISDGGAWGKCKLKLALDRNTVNIPENNNLPLTTTKVPYVIVADDAFPLSVNLMKPYPGRGLNDEEMIFNYRLSRARRASENAFGILAARFQIFKQRIPTSPVNATKIVMARCALHNF